MRKMHIHFLSAYRQMMRYKRRRKRGACVAFSTVERNTKSEWNTLVYISSIYRKPNK